jgi:hypothetical protein
VPTPPTPVRQPSRVDLAFRPCVAPSRTAIGRHPRKSTSPQRSADQHSTQPSSLRLCRRAPPAPRAGNKTAVCLLFSHHPRRRSLLARLFTLSLSPIPTQEVVAGDDADEGTDVSSDEEGEEEGKKVERKEGRGRRVRAPDLPPLSPAWAEKRSTHAPGKHARSLAATHTHTHTTPLGILTHSFTHTHTHHTHTQMTQAGPVASSPGARRRRGRRWPSSG